VVPEPPNDASVGSWGFVYREESSVRRAARAALKTA
jgi:hypothetical protein